MVLQLKGWNLHESIHSLLFYQYFYLWLVRINALISIPVIYLFGFFLKG